MTTKQVLQKARAIIKKGWCQNSFAKTSDGRYVNWNDPGAVSFCIAGAIYKAAGRERGTGRILDALTKATGCSALADYNDPPERTQADVLAAFSLAIKACR